MSREPVVSRRALLRMVGGTTVGLATAGCNQATSDTTRTATQTPTDGKPETPTSTPVDDQAPTIHDYRADPRQNGTALYVHMKGEDDRGLAKGRIVYADRELTRDLDGKHITIDGTLQNTATVTPDNKQVLYVLTDAAGNETRKEAYPDTTPPDLTVETHPTETAGDIDTTITAHDDTGLAEIRTLLNGDTLQTHDTSGSTEYTDQQTLTVPQDLRGRRVPVGAHVQDWNGNATEKDIKAYVRKYDLMDDTRLDFGVEYEPFFNEFKKFDMEGRQPTIGQYGDEDGDVPYPEWVYNRHLDQMSGFGVTTVRLPVSDIREGSRTKRADDAFLESELLDQIDVGVHYVIAPHLWDEGYGTTADDYRTDLIEPHMEYIRDNILARDNAITYDGRPVMDIWNPIQWMANDYINERVMDEWGSYDALMDDIRSHLTIDGTDPFIVGGFGGWGNDYLYADIAERAELARQFDGVTTWVGGGAWGDDNFVSQDKALDWIEDDWQGHRKFTDAHDMEFVPMVFPGFNEVKEPQRRTPRSPEFFADLMGLADQYRTTDMVWTPPYNNWEEATHFEPGTFEPGPFGAKNYGTAYLNIVKKFQQRGTA